MNMVEGGERQERTEVRRGRRSRREVERVRARLHDLGSIEREGGLLGEPGRVPYFSLWQIIANCYSL